MYFPVPVRSLLQNVISSKTFLFPPTIKELVHCNRMYDVFTGRKDCFTIHDKRIITFVMHRHDLMSKKFTTTFETRHFSKDLSQRYVEFIHLTPEKPVLMLDHLSRFEETYNQQFQSNYHIQYHLIKNNLCSKDIKTEVYDDNIDTFDNIVNQSLSNSYINLLIN